MKKLTKENPPRSTIEVDEYFKNGDYRFNLVGMEACGGKYVLSPTSSGAIVFSSGNSIWLVADSVRRIIELVMNDARCTVYLFDSSVELGRWLAGIIGP